MGNGPVFSASVRIKEHFVKMEALGAKEHFSVPKYLYPRTDGNHQ